MCYTYAINNERECAMHPWGSAPTIQLIFALTERLVTLCTILLVSPRPRLRTTLRKRTERWCIIFFLFEINRQLDNSKFRFLFFQLALRYHPDKNPDNPAAADQVFSTRIISDNAENWSSCCFFKNRIFSLRISTMPIPSWATLPSVIYMTTMAPSACTSPSNLGRNM